MAGQQMHGDNLQKTPAPHVKSANLEALLNAPRLLHSAASAPLLPSKEATLSGVTVTRRSGSARPQRLSTDRAMKALLADDGKRHLSGTESCVSSSKASAPHKKVRKAQDGFEMDFSDAES